MCRAVPCKRRHFSKTFKEGIVIESLNWRKEARAALRAYTAAKKKQALTKEEHITPNYGGLGGGNNLRRPTEQVALYSPLSPYEERVISAVEFMLKMQSVYANADERMRMIRSVYFSRTHNIEGAALECHYCRERLFQWNTEILSAVYIAMEFQKRQESAAS